MVHAGMESRPDEGMLVLGPARFTVEEDGYAIRGLGSVGRVYWRWTCEVKGETWSAADLGEPAIGIRDDRNGRTREREMLGSFLSFLSAALESREFRRRTEREGENEALFPAAMLDALQAATIGSEDVSLAAMETDPYAYGLDPAEWGASS